MRNNTCIRMPWGAVVNLERKHLIRLLLRVVIPPMRPIPASQGQKRLGLARCILVCQVEQLVGCLRHSACVGHGQRIPDYGFERTPEVDDLPTPTLVLLVISGPDPLDEVRRVDRREVDVRSDHRPCVRSIVGAVLCAEGSLSHTMIKDEYLRSPEPSGMSAARLYS